MWCWRKEERKEVLKDVLHIRRTEKKTNEEVLLIVNEKIKLIRTIDNKREKNIDAFIQYYNFFKTIWEEKEENQDEILWSK